MAGRCAKCGDGPSHVQASPAQFRSELLQIKSCCWGLARPSSRGSVSKSPPSFMRMGTSFAFFLLIKFISRETLLAAGTRMCSAMPVRVPQENPSLPTSLGYAHPKLSCSSSFKALCLLHAILVRFKRHEQDPGRPMREHRTSYRAQGVRLANEQRTSRAPRMTLHRISGSLLQLDAAF